ncbi:type II secretion system protein GspD [Achromobacter aegrifaciens]
MTLDHERMRIDWALKEIMVALDVPSWSVIVRAVLYEVSDSAMEASALKVIADLVNGKVGVSIGGAGLSGNSLSISSTSLDFVASMISEDSRFKILTRPFLRVQNGKSARFQVGQDVPVVGEILFNPNGQSAQSFKYVSSGVIFEVAAHIREGAIGLDIVQTVSNFVKTTVGNSENPTANKREISTSLTLGDGEIVILGGLSDEQRERSAQGLFGWNFAKSEGTRNSQLVLVLQAQRV